MRVCGWRVAFSHHEPPAKNAHNKKYSRILPIKLNKRRYPAIFKRRAVRHSLLCDYSKLATVLVDATDDDEDSDDDDDDDDA